MALFPPSSSSGAPPASRPGQSGGSFLSGKSAPAGRAPLGSSLLLAQGSSLAGKTSLPPSAGLNPMGGTRTFRVSQEEFIQLRDFIYEKCGIYIAENRKYLIENRLSNRIKELNLKTFGEYYYFLRFDVGKQAELIKLFEVITTNETSFYRNPPQLQVFQDVVLRGELDKLRKAGLRKLRIWSAGCSTGEEPYTLAIILNEVLGADLLSWDLKITANDLSEAVLATARAGAYGEYALRTTPAPIIARYFTKTDPDYLIDAKLKRIISFGHINLSDKAQVRRVERSHIVFCRNVIIYFDDEMKKQIIESFYDNLLPGGCLFIGHAESLHNISRAFKPEHHAGTIVYRKEA
jgi:chemotaxis protein methyltransferase CheR